jgi:hypothetical protein
VHSLHVDAAAVVAKVYRVFVARSRDWDAMAALYHPQALIVTVTGGPDPLPADELIAELQRASADTWYAVKSWKTYAIDEHAVIVSGRMRRSVPRGGFEDAAHVWLLTVRDDLIYRQGVYGTEEEAVDAYRRLGVDLGITATPAPDGREQSQPESQPAPLPGLDPALGEG